MKKVLKFLPLLVLVVALFAFNACTPAPAPQPAQPPAPVAEQPPATPEPTPEPPPSEPVEQIEDAGDIRIALVAHSPESILDDGSFNAGAWVGIGDFLTANGLPESNRQFFQPTSADDEARINLVEDAIETFGADVVVLPGFHFISSSYRMQNYFPDVQFILLDASPAGGISNNLVAIHYAEEESGFFAGYAAVVNGYRELGFMGGAAVPAVVRFGHGFIQGAEHAAASLGLEEGDVTVRFHYIGGFAPDPAVATHAGSWFAAGTEVIFAAAGGAGFSVISAAEAAGASVIGVDVDQGHASEVVVTSAVKGLAASVNAMLIEYVNGQWRGGNELMFNAAVNGVGLPMESSRMDNFSQAQYDAIFGQVASGAVSVSASLDFDEILESISLVEVDY